MKCNVMLNSQIDNYQYTTTVRVNTNKSNGLLGKQNANSPSTRFNFPNHLFFNNCKELFISYMYKQS